MNKIYNVIVIFLIICFVLNMADYRWREIKMNNDFEKRIIELEAKVLFILQWDEIEYKEAE